MEEKIDIDYNAEPKEVLDGGIEILPTNTDEPQAKPTAEDFNYKPEIIRTTEQDVSDSISNIEGQTAAANEIQAELDADSKLNNGTNA